MNKEDRDTILKASRVILLTSTYGIVKNKAFSNLTNDDILSKKEKYIAIAYDLYFANIFASTIASVSSALELLNPGTYALGVADAALTALFESSAVSQFIQVSLVKKRIEALRNVKNYTKNFVNEEEFNSFYEQLMSYQDIVLDGKEILSKKLDACREVNTL
jgi:hypothetical protein